MNTRALLATVATAVVAFFLGWMIFGVVLMDFYTANTTTYEGLERYPSDLFAIFVSNMAMSYLLVYVFTKSGVQTVVDGALGGLIIFGLITISVNLYFYATKNLLSPLVLIADLVVNGIYGSVLGATAALILSYRKPVVSS